jgi:hypothetical protein
VGSLEPIEPGELKDFQAQQAGRVRGFLTRLATDDDLLLRYINDRVGVLRHELKRDDLGDDRLTTEDVALLLDSDYSRVYEVMSQGSQPLRWIIIWII